MGDQLRFYAYGQESALPIFLPLLQPYLPLSNPLYNRLKAPQNIPSRKCVFAATFSPSQPPPSSLGDHTILFSDRSRHSESQIWVFNAIISKPDPPSEHDNALVDTHVQAMISFLKTTEVPEAPGWPFDPCIKFSCFSERLAKPLLAYAYAKDAVTRTTEWNFWVIPTQSKNNLQHKNSLPEGYTISRVPPDQLDIVLSTSTIVRQRETMLALPSVGILNPEGKLVAWGFTGIDGSFATLYSLPECRGRGFATYVAKELLGKLGRGEFRDLGFDGESGWAHSDVKVGNEGSEGVMRSIGGEVVFRAWYMMIDSDRL
ncbi:acetyltransferase [Phlyctema vagabunda]|uniref:Acetyltransferase n=1 Tax=Phlyctema vagabunda TaxID=108571 RepID=A0ABR4PRZ8_9HELO